MFSFCCLLGIQAATGHCDEYRFHGQSLWQRKFLGCWNPHGSKTRQKWRLLPCTVQNSPHNAKLAVGQESQLIESGKNQPTVSDQPCKPYRMTDISQVFVQIPPWWMATSRLEVATSWIASPVVTQKSLQVHHPSLMIYQVYVKMNWLKTVWMLMMLMLWTYQQKLIQNWCSWVVPCWCTRSVASAASWWLCISTGAPCGGLVNEFGETSWHFHFLNDETSNWKEVMKLSLKLLLLFAIVDWGHFGSSIWFRPECQKNAQTCQIRYSHEMAFEKHLQQIYIHITK